MQNFDRRLFEKQTPCALRQFLTCHHFLDLAPKYYRPWLYQTNSIWPTANGITAQQLVLGAERTPANTILVIVTT